MMLFNAMKKAKLFAQDEHLDILINATLTGDDNVLAEFQEVLTELMSGDRSKKSFEYNKWIKAEQMPGKRSEEGRKGPQKYPMKSTVGQAAEELSTSLVILIAHLDRNKKIKAVIKQKRAAVQEPGSQSVLCHFDYAENFTGKVSNDMMT